MHHYTQYTIIFMKYTVAFAIVPFYVNGLSFEPAIQRHKRRTIVKENQSSKCPFASLPKWFGSSSVDTFETVINSSIDLQFSRDNMLKQLVPKISTVPDIVDSTPAIGLSLLTSWRRKYIIFSEKVYRDALAYKCPFFRRRATDVLEFVDNTIRMSAGHDLVFFGPAIAFRQLDNAGEKRVGLSSLEIMEIIRKDWREETRKGYYVTGRLSTDIYRDDCLFDGPDPDMPVRGLRKYMNAASQLFDYKSSTSELLSLIVKDDIVVARWKFNGTMRLPWRPKLPEVTGSTTYHIDATGLIHKHVETWDISAFQAFFQTFFPNISRRIWR